jgi:iron complex outermembrane receptor protein
MMRRVPTRSVAAAAVAAALAAPPAAAQTPTVQADPVVVTATRIEQKSFDVPAAIDSIPGVDIQSQQLRTNISETLVRVPGIVANNRQNYAQDLQISARGFGSRATFGVRGVRLIQDGIPLTMPDGQGQTALFNLDSAKRIEVLRGPFSALYGNSSGGVIQLFTEDGPPRPTLGGSASFGSYDTRRYGLKFGGQAGALNYTLDASRFSTDGYRDHSSAVRDFANAKARFTLDGQSSLTVLGNFLDQPDTLDPLGLTQAQLDADRRQAGTGALQFNTRKSVRHGQGGLAYERRLTSSDTLTGFAYGGDRQVTQYLAIPLSFQQAATASGGVVDLDRQFGGGGLAWRHAAGPFAVTAGLDYDTMKERRKGFINDNGVQGALKRDEDDRVHNFDQYVLGEWKFAERWRLSGGVRHSEVKFKSQDYFIVPLTQNGDDSGSVRYSATNPVVGLLYEATPAVNLYLAAGRGFETPTFAELAYRPDGQPGLNFALEPAISHNYEAGVKAFVGAATRVNLALFLIETQDEIVTARSVGGRASFTNASKTRRTGLELAADTVFGGGFTGYAAYTWIDAEFKDYANPFSTQNLSGKKLPGVPGSSLYGEVAWRHAGTGFSTAIEARYSAKVYADDANTASAPAYWVFNWRGGFEQRVGNWRFAEFVRVDNLAGKEYVGSLIVNEANQRYYEPSPTRTWLVGLTAAYAF